MVKAIIQEQIYTEWRKENKKRIFARYFKAISSESFRPLIVVFLFDGENEDMPPCGIEVMVH
jgi:hypothetical protein